MRKNYLVYVIAVGLLLAYILIINAVGSLMSNESSYSGGVEGNDYGDVVVGVSDNVDVSVVKNRWYGTILENSGRTTKLSKLYLMGFIPLPLNVNGGNLVWIHIIFAMCLIAGIYFGMKRMKRYYFERGYF